ncbi:type III secretion system cytoplasmic ring protein SctQ [Bradyrhizobium iriomotense]|uniref:Translocation protein Y4yK n=1 Tax=Bradyrhizobium iriomotense TaxID=441950 RepID=A0ABQ6BG15_9BRAD|nr:type III secretion system cytoplasmic ring protein SctQ [Bradyrhizobium iriomotense]GLR91103.1 putative translocation protein Y4yK [Bradyrhizobium iriomotense]
MSASSFASQTCCLVDPPAANPADEYATYEPSLILTHAFVAWLNSIATPRTPLQTSLGDKLLSVRLERLVWQVEPSAISMLDCVWGVGDETIVLSIPHALAEALISAVQSGLTLPSEPSRSLVLELALEPLLAPLENQIQQRLQLLRVGKAETIGPYIEFGIIYGPVRTKGRLFLFSPLDGPIPPAFHALGELFGQLPRETRKLSKELPIIVAGELGALRATASLLRKTSAGDALLPDVMPFARGEITLTAGRLWTVADVAGNRLILRRPFRLVPRPLEYAHMTTPPRPQHPPSEADLDDIEVTLVFECGRWPITLGALRGIGEGHVFELGRPVDGPVDILANGRRIGSGDIVRIGDELGIRLRGRLAGHD